MMASRGEVRSPLPTRSEKRSASTCEPCRREGDERADDVRQRVPGHDPSLPLPDPVRKVPGVELEQRGGRLGDALDDAERGGAGSEHGGQERGQERIDHLGSAVVQKTDETEDDDVPAEPAFSSLMLPAFCPSWKQTLPDLAFFFKKSLRDTITGRCEARTGDKEMRDRKRSGPA